MSRLAKQARAFVTTGVIAGLLVPGAGVAQDLVGKWRYDIEGLPTYWIFSDCGVLEIRAPGSSAEFRYSVEDSGPPLKLQVCGAKDSDEKCGSVYVYVLGTESLQLLPDFSVPRVNAVPLTDMLMQRVPDDRGDAQCKLKPGDPPSRE